MSVGCSSPFHINFIAHSSYSEFIKHFLPYVESQWTVHYDHEVFVCE